MDSREKHVLGRWKNMCGRTGGKEPGMSEGGERQMMGAARFALGSQTPGLLSVTVYLTL